MLYAQVPGKVLQWKQKNKVKKKNKATTHNVSGTKSNVWNDVKSIRF